jgi:uncharacterized protein (TIGR00290 family)
MSWSGGKDSALALAAIKQDDRLEVVGLLTTITANYDRISMHGVRTSLLRAQCDALGLPLLDVTIPPACSNADYEAALLARLSAILAGGVHHVVFGDLFLEDIRAYRQALLDRIGMSALFPLWGLDTRVLADKFVDDGFRAVIVCVDPRQLASDFCGREFDQTLLTALPLSCDPCGERGEFHTFVYDGPIFSEPVPITRGTIHERGGFAFYDLCLETPRHR